jgi:geranylgeranyl diphosphate synthase, type III
MNLWAISTPLAAHRSMHFALLQALLEPYTYITSNPGKEIRGAMIEAFNTWLNVPEDKLKIIARVVSMLHSASLL